MEEILLKSTASNLHDDEISGAFLKNTYELLNLRALKFLSVNKIYIFHCMGKIFCVEFQRYPLQFHTKYLTRTLKIWFFYNSEILRALRFKSSYAFWNAPQTRFHVTKIIPLRYGAVPGLILGLRPASERRRYKVTPSIIGWAQT